MAKLSAVGKYFSKYSAVLVLSIILGWTTIAHAATTTATITSISPSTGIKNGQSLTVTGTGFTANNETGLSECNSIGNEPYQVVYGNDVPVGCNNPISVLFNTDSSGNFTHSFSAIAGQVGPPNPSVATDSRGTGSSAQKDAKMYPCPPTGQQMLQGDVCNINAGDFAGDTDNGQSPSYNISFYTPPLTPPTGVGFTIVNSSQIRLAWTSATGGIGSDFTTCNVSTLVGCKGGSRYYIVYKNGVYQSKIAPPIEDSTYNIFNSIVLTSNSTFTVKAEDYANNMSSASNSVTFYPFVKITGKVTSTTGAALKGVKITDVASGKTYSATTTSTGMYTLAKVPAAKNSFVFKLTGYNNASYSVVLGTSASRVINVKLAKG